jgi:elongation factor G
MRFPDPVLSVAVEPRSERETDALEHALDMLQQEDPTVRVHLDPETGQRILSGMGELHLEVLLDRMQREFHVHSRVGQPQVAYLETVTARAEATGRYERRSDAEGVFGEVTVVVEPLARGSGVDVADGCPEGMLPQSLREAAFQGARSALANGVVGGYPVVDVRVTLVGGRVDERFSTPLAFEAAAAIAVRSALADQASVLLEPIMQIQVVTPEEHLGKVLGDLHARRVQIHGVGARDRDEVIEAEAPLAEMFAYTTTLRSLTQGRGTHTMEFSRYEALPAGAVERTRARRP